MKLRSGVKYIAFSVSALALFDAVFSKAVSRGFDPPQKHPLYPDTEWIVERNALSFSEWNDLAYKHKIFLGVTWVFATSGITFTIPGDWTNSNTINVIGAGTGGAAGTGGSCSCGIPSGGSGGSGGAGGAWAQITNFSATPGQVISIQVGTSDTWWNSTLTLLAQAAVGTSPGLAVNSVGTLKNNGGSPGTIGLGSNGGGGGSGGGGAGGPTGAGGNGSNGANAIGINPGAGGGGGTGDGGVTAANANGTEFGPNAGGTFAGSGGGGDGGAGGSAQGSGNPGVGGTNAGLYGAGGGGGGGGGGPLGAGGSPGAGTQGLIALSYTAAVLFGGFTQSETAVRNRFIFKASQQQFSTNAPVVITTTPVVQIPWWFTESPQITKKAFIEKQPSFFGSQLPIVLVSISARTQFQLKTLAAYTTIVHPTIPATARIYAWGYDERGSPIYWFIDEATGLGAKDSLGKPLNPE
jgi:hypothetical protein